MPGASFIQSSFLGGEWSPFAQGRFERPDYKTAMNVCLNTIPLEEGCAARRPGERFLGTTRRGNPGKLIAVDFIAAAPYNMEFTDGHLRFWGSVLDGSITRVTTNTDVVVSSISTANPAVATIGTARSWATDDQISFFFGYTAAAFTPLLRNRDFRIRRLTSTTYELFDAITNAPIDGATLGWGTGPGAGIVTALHILDKVTPYTAGSWATLRSIQSDIGAILLQGSYQPRLLTMVAPSTQQYATFDLAAADFIDGPYLDPLDLGATVSGTSGSVNFTIPSSPLFSFAATDVGRLIRIFSEPLAWDAGTGYNAGDTVAFQDAFYVSLTSNTGSQPDTSITDWGITTAAAGWGWGKITAFTSAVEVVLTLETTLITANPVNIWQAGVFSDTTGWPTCGTYHDGRLWLSGAVKNRVDAGRSNKTLDFSPTAQDGTVADDNAISYTFNATDTNPVFWMQPTSQGIVCGTQGGEWLIRASNLDDPLTPTSIQAKRVTKYGCANIEPRETGLTLVFAQRWGRKLFEYFPDVFSNRFTAPNLARDAAHITKAGVAEIAFQKERTPIIWSRFNDNTLAGMSYKRDVLASSQGPEYVAWHRHELGSGREIESICVGPSQFGNLDGLSMITNGEDGIRHVSMLTDAAAEDDNLKAAWLLDDAIAPSGGVVDHEANTITFHGLWHLNGEEVTAFVAGLDCGEGTVADGSLTLSFRDGIENLFSYAYIKGACESYTSSVPAFIDVPDNDSTTVYIERFQAPVVIGYSYSSRGQLLRRIATAEAGAANGPAMGKTQRVHQYSVMVVNGITAAMKVGADFDHLKPAAFRTKGQKDYAVDRLFSGIHQDTLDDEYGFDSMICWEITRPLPMTIAAFGGFIQTQDK